MYLGTKKRINMSIKVPYLGVGEPIASHAVGENDNKPEAGAKRLRQLRLIDTRYLKPMQAPR